jgi:hypothetical protein
VVGGHAYQKESPQGIQTQIAAGGFYGRRHFFDRRILATKVPEFKEMRVKFWLGGSQRLELARPDQGAKPLTLQLGWAHWILRGLFLDGANNGMGTGQPEAPYERATAAENPLTKT